MVEARHYNGLTAPDPRPSRAPARTIRSHPLFHPLLATSDERTGAIALPGRWCAGTHRLGAPINRPSQPLIGRVRSLSALHSENLAHHEVNFRVVKKQNTCLKS